MNPSSRGDEVKNTKNNTNSNKYKDMLLIGINNKNGKITYFSKNCEILTGFKKNKVIGRNISDLLIQKKYAKQWKKIFDSIKSNKKIEDFQIPWLTAENKEVPIIWNSLLTKKTMKKTEKHLYLIGKILKEHEKDGRENKIILFRLGNKKIIFRKRKKENHVDSEKAKDIPKRKHSENEYKKTLDKISEEFNEKLKKLEKKMDKKLERENKMLHKSLNEFKAKIPKNNKTTKETENISKQIISEKANSKKNTTNPSKKMIFPLPGFLTKRGRWKEMESRIDHDLDERRHLLETLEKHLIQEIEYLDKKREEFSKWREKLEKLEEEIEERRKELVRQEQEFRDQIMSFSNKKTGGIAADVEGTPLSNEIPISKEKIMDYSDTDLEEIPYSAAIIQRGIIKQVNQSFIHLLGYSVEEIIDKSLFDFIVPEKLDDVKKYYLCRLKGEDVSTYETLLSTKYDKKTVKISVKPTVYNGEKADIAIIQELNK